MLTQAGRNEMIEKVYVDAVTYFDDLPVHTLH